MRRHCRRAASTRRVRHSLRRNLARRPARISYPAQVRADQCRLDQNATADLKAGCLNKLSRLSQNRAAVQKVIQTASCGHPIVFTPHVDFVHIALTALRLHRPCCVRRFEKNIADGGEASPRLRTGRAHAAGAVLPSCSRSRSQPTLLRLVRTAATLMATTGRNTCPYSRLPKLTSEQPRLSDSGRNRLLKSSEWKRRCATIESGLPDLEINRAASALFLNQRCPLTPPKPKSLLVESSWSESNC
jgi:hypothetical protein